MSFTKRVKNFLFVTKPVEVPKNCKSCPDCGGTGDFDALIDCLTCDGQGYLENKTYYRYLNAGEFNNR